jgi:hypothetical protein
LATLRNDTTAVMSPTSPGQEMDFFSGGECTTRKCTS